MNRTSIARLLSLLLILAAACKFYKEDDAVVLNPKTIAQIIAEQPDLSRITAALRRTPYYDTLNKPANKFTVFLPSNQALTDAGVNIEGIQGEALNNLLAYHITRAQTFVGNLPDSMRTLNASGPSLFHENYDIGGTKYDVLNYEARILKSDIRAVNGLINILDRPVSLAAGSQTATLAAKYNGLVASMASGLSDDFSIFKAALRRANTFSVAIRNSLSTGGGVTVIAPTNAAFQAIGVADTAALSAIPAEQLQSILQYHIIARGNLQRTESEMVANPTTAGYPVYIEFYQRSGAPASQPYANGKLLTPATAPAGSSLYTSGAVLLRSTQTVRQLIDTDTAYTLLKRAFVRLDTSSYQPFSFMADTAKGNAGNTVFLPNDRAWAAVRISGDSIDRMNIDSLAALLTYHIIPGRYFFSTFDRINTPQGATSRYDTKLKTIKYDPFTGQPVSTVTQQAFIFTIRATGVRRTRGKYNGLTDIPNPLRLGTVAPANGDMLFADAVVNKTDVLLRLLKP